MASAKDVKDVLDARREFVFKNGEGEEESYFVASPGASDIRKADWQYSKVYNQAIVDGFLTQSQMVNLLRDKGILSEEYTDKIEHVRINLAADLFRLENMGDSLPDTDKEALAMEIARFRDELFRLNQQVNGPMGNTCENLAEDARVEFLTSRVVQNKDGSRVWEEFSDYQNEVNSAFCIKARFEVMLWMQGLESNFMDSTPEQVVLRELAQKRLDTALNDAKKRALDEARKESAEDEATKGYLQVAPAVEEELELMVPKEESKVRRGRKKDEPITKSSKRGRVKKTD